MVRVPNASLAPAQDALSPVLFERNTVLGPRLIGHGEFPATDLVQCRWQIGEERKGTRPSRLAMNKAAINAAILRR